MAAVTPVLTTTRAPQGLKIQNSAQYLTIVTVVGPASYTTGGDTLDLVAAGGVLGRGGITNVMVKSNKGYEANWLTTKKLQVWASAGTEVSNATDLSAVTFTLWILST